MLFLLEKLAKQFGGRSLFRDLTLDVRPLDRIALVGPNGAGKTTLLRMVAGLEPLDGGRVVMSRGVRVGLLRQELDASSERSIRDEVASSQSELDELETEIRSLEATMEERGRTGEEVSAELAERYDRSRAAFEFGGGFQREARRERVLEGLGFDAAARERPLRSFSGGWIMRVELAKLLLSSPDVLLLDEPTNHLDLPSIQWFEETLSEYRGAVLLISHDRSLLRKHATRIAELDAGRFTVYDCPYEPYLRRRAERREQLRAEQRTQERKIAEARVFIDRFRAKASKARQVQSRIKALDRIERVHADEGHARRMKLRIPPPKRSGDIVLTLRDIHKSYGKTVVYQGVELELRREERVALVGPNGAGKSTLLRIAAGILPFERGERREGAGVEVAFFAQHQLEALRMERTVLEELESVAGMDDVPRLRGHLGAFLFSGEDVEKRVRVLSGGEKARLALAKMLLRPANFLVLDEPTNHLDVDACEILEEALRDFRGTLLLISHDRTFINNLASRIVEVRYGRLESYPGSYDDYLRASQGAAAPADEPGERPDKRERLAVRAEARRRARELEKDRKRLAALEAGIATHEREIETLTWKLADPGLYREPEKLRSWTEERDALRSALRALYGRWEGLASSIESAESEADEEPPGR